MGVELAPRRGCVPLQPRHPRHRRAGARHDGRLRRRPHHQRAGAPDHRGARRATRRRSRRRPLPPRRGVPPPVRGARRLGRRRVRAAARPHRQGRGAAHRSGGREARRAHGGVASGRRRSGGGSGLERHADLAVGPGHSPAPAPVRAALRRSTDACRRPSTSCAASACSRASRWSTCRAPLPASTTTTALSVTPRSPPSPIATSSSCTWRPPTRPAIRAAIDEKVRSLELWDSEVIGPIGDALRGTPHRILLLPDHATPCGLRTHTSAPVPYLFFDSRGRGSRWCVHRGRGRRRHAGRGAHADGARRPLTRPAGWVPAAPEGLAGSSHPMGVWLQGPHRGTVDGVAGRCRACSLSTAAVPSLVPRGNSP